MTPDCGLFVSYIYREAKRANSFVKTQKHFNESLQSILDNKGRPSDIFPKTVNELLEFNGQLAPFCFHLSIICLLSESQVLRCSSL